jgi:hypothetical protein
MKREDPFHADPIRDFSHRKSLLQTTVLHGDHYSLKDLNPLGASLDNLEVNLHGISIIEVLDILFQLFRFNCLY